MPLGGHNRDEILKAETIETGGGYAPIIDFQDGSTYSKAVFTLNVAAVSGTAPTLNVYIQTELSDGSWVDMVAFSTMAGVGKRHALVATPVPSQAADVDFAAQDRQLAAGTVRHLLLGPRYRVGWLIAGVAPSFTFSVKGTIHT